MCFPNNPGPLLKTPDCAVLVKTSNYFFFLHIIFQTTPGPAPTHLAASTSSEKSSTRSSEVSWWSLQVWISLSLSFYTCTFTFHSHLLTVFFHFNLFRVVCVSCSQYTRAGLDLETVFKESAVFNQETEYARCWYLWTIGFTLQTGINEEILGQSCAWS